MDTDCSLLSREGSQQGQRFCRAFNVRLSEEQRRGAQAQATYKWLDDFSPVPDFGVASQDLPAIIPPARGFSPVFSGSISNSPEQ